MTEIRIYELLRGHKLKDYEYTWDTTYNTILTADDFNSNTRIDSLVLNFGIYPAYDTTTIDFIFPFRYGYDMLLDGVARGSIQLVSVSPATVDASIQMYADINLLARDESSVDRTLGTTTTKTINEISVCCGKYDYYDIPFFIDLDNVVINYNERFILQVITYCRSNNYGSKFYLDNTLNTNNVFIELPVVQ